MDYFIYQTDLKECGPISLRIFAAHFFKDRAYLTMSMRMQTPSSFLTLVQTAASFQCVLKGYRLVRLSLLKTIRSVMIVHLDAPLKHFIVAKRYFLFFWKIYDPAKGIQYVSFNYFKKYKASAILLPSKKESIKALTFHYFKMTSIHPWFYWLTGIFIFMLFFAIFLVPSPMFITSMMLLFASFALVWIVYVLHQFSRHHQTMDQQYQHLINDKEDFKTYHQIKADYYSLPLKALYYGLSVTMVVLYFFLIQTILVPFLILSSALAIGLMHPLDQWMTHLIAKIEKIEESLTYPLQPTILISITTLNYRYVLSLIIRYVLLTIIAIVTLLLASFITPISGTQWLLTLSLFLSTYHHAIHLRNLPRLEHKVYTLMNAFINKVNMVK